MVLTEQRDMISEYTTVYKDGEGEIVEKKSRFIAVIRHVDSVEEALEMLESLRKQYWDARHHCYAYIIGKKSECMRFGDDGEPGGTAGKPMLEVLQSRKLCNVCAVVIRYFGGTLLGTGGVDNALDIFQPKNIRTYLKTLSTDGNARRILSGEFQSFIEAAKKTRAMFEEEKLALEEGGDEP